MRPLLVIIPLLWLLGCEPEQPQQPPSLLDAAEQGDLQTMDNFLQGSQLVNMRNACLWTPLMKAALNGHLEAVKKLLAKGADVRAIDKGGYSAMMLAASNNFADVVDVLIQHGADINRIEHTHGWSALIWAAKRGHLESVKVLLKHGADKSIVDDDEMTALKHAQEKAYTKVVEALLTPPIETATPNGSQ